MRPVLIVSVCLMFCASAIASAENNVLPPPSVDTSAIHAADAPADIDEHAPNLSEALKAPDADGRGDVRSYQRKDGATITEYSLHGQIYEIKVQPAGGLPAYYLYRNKAGHFERRRPGGQPAITPPSWILKKF